MQEMQEMRVQSLGQGGPLEEGMATHSNIFTWKILYRVARLAKVHGPQSIGHDWARAHTHTHTHNPKYYKLKFGLAYKYLREVEVGYLQNMNFIVSKVNNLYSNVCLQTQIVQFIYIS